MKGSAIQSQENQVFDSEWEQVTELCPCLAKGEYTVPCLNTYPLQTADVIVLLGVSCNTHVCCTFLPCFQQQVDDFLNVYCSVPESIQKESAWETQTYVHFCDGQGVALTLKPEHRVEDVLSLACKVLIFRVRLHLVNSCGLEKECNISGDA